MKTSATNIRPRYLSVLAILMFIGTAACNSTKGPKNPFNASVIEVGLDGIGHWSYHEDDINGTTTLLLKSKVKSVDPKWKVDDLNLEFVFSEKDGVLSPSFECRDASIEFSFWNESNWFPSSKALGLYDYTKRIILVVKDIVIDLGETARDSEQTIFKLAGVERYELVGQTLRTIRTKYIGANDQFYAFHYKKLQSKANLFVGKTIKDANGAKRLLDAMKESPVIEIHCYIKTFKDRLFKQPLKEDKKLVLKFDNSGFSEMMREIQKKRGEARITEDRIMEAVTKIEKDNGIGPVLSLDSKAKNLTGEIVATGSKLWVGLREKNAWVEFLFNNDYAHPHAKTYLPAHMDEAYLQIKDLRIRLDGPSSVSVHYSGNWAGHFYCGTMIKDLEDIKKLMKAIKENPDDVKVIIYGREEEEKSELVIRRRASDGTRLRDSLIESKTTKTGNYVNTTNVFEFQAIRVASILRDMEETLDANKAIKERTQNVEKEITEDIIRKTRENFLTTKNLAESGSTKAMFVLAKAYYYGIGTPQDRIAAAMWANIAQEYGSDEGFRLCGILKYDERTNYDRTKADKIMEEIERKHPEKKRIYHR